MTVISEPVATIAGADSDTWFEFAAPAVRDSGTGLITVSPIRLQPVSGVLTTPNLKPGPAVVRVGLKLFSIEIPNSATPIRLWPLIEAGLPIPPEEMASAVVNGGGFARAKVMSEAEYTDLVAGTTPDPGSVFFVY